MCRLQKCCCCIDLPTGAKILGILGIIGNLFYILFCLVGIFSYQTIIEEMVRQKNESVRLLLEYETGKF
jgi:hypothetical protein